MVFSCGECYPKIHGIVQRQMTGLSGGKMRRLGAMALALALGAPARADFSQATPPPAHRETCEIYWIDAEGRRRHADRRAGRRVAAGGLREPHAGRSRREAHPCRRAAGGTHPDRHAADDALPRRSHRGDAGAGEDDSDRPVPRSRRVGRDRAARRSRPPIKAYVDQSAGKRRILKPGDRIPMAGVDIRDDHVGGSADHEGLKGAGARNDCADFVAHAPDTIPTTIRASASS